MCLRVSAGAEQLDDLGHGPEDTSLPSR
jgi:hypothetical protein